MTCKHLDICFIKHIRPGGNLICTLLTLTWMDLDFKFIKNLYDACITSYLFLEIIKFSFVILNN